MGLNNIDPSRIRTRSFMQKLHEERENNRIREINQLSRLNQGGSIGETIVTLNTDIVSHRLSEEVLNWIPITQFDSPVSINVAQQATEVVPQRPSSVPYPEQLGRNQTNKKTGREYGLSPILRPDTIKLHKADKEVKLVFDKHPFVYNYELPTTGLEVSIVKAPTGNCQSYCISDFNFLVEEENDGGTKVIDSLKVIHKRIRKPLLALDVKYNIAPTVREIFKHAIVHETQYTSTSGSAMCSFLVKTLLLEN